MEELYREVVRPAYTGLGAATTSWVVEVGPKSGLPHSHGLAYQEEDPGPASLSSLLGRLQQGEGGLTWEERERVVELGRSAITVTTSARDLSQQFQTLTEEDVQFVVAQARSRQQHYCSHHCFSSSHNEQTCGQYFPRLPSLLPLVAMRPALETEEQRARLEALETIAKRVQGLLRGLARPLQPLEEPDPATSLLLFLQEVADPPALLPGGGYTWAGVTFPPSQELEHLRQECETLANSPEAVDLLVVYHASLLSRRHAKYLPPRRVEECWGVNYNPWLLKAARSNVEVEIVTHTPKSLYSYMTKGATSQTILQTADEVDSRGGRRMGDMAGQLRLAVEEGWREVSLTEAFFLLDRDLRLFTSSSPVRWVGLQPFSGIVALYILRWTF